MILLKPRARTERHVNRGNGPGFRRTRRPTCLRWASAARPRDQGQGAERLLRGRARGSRTSTSTSRPTSDGDHRPSGSGKSTVVRCINRMHEEIPALRAEGSITLEGSMCTRRRRPDRGAAMIGMVFQKPNPFPTMSIFDNVAAGLRLTGTKSDNLRERVHRLAAGGRALGECQERLNQPGIGLSAASSSACASPGRWRWSPR